MAAGFKDVLRLTIHWLAVKIYGDIDERKAFIQRTQSVQAFMFRTQEIKAER